MAVACAICTKEFSGRLPPPMRGGSMYCPDCIQELREKAPVNPVLDAQLKRKKEGRR